MRTKFGFERNRDTLNEVFNSKQSIKLGYDGNLSEEVEKQKIIDKIWEIDPTMMFDLTEWTIEELKEIALSFGINIQSSRRPIKSNAYTDGYDAYYDCLEKSDNPYFSASEPIEYQEWERGWKVAEQDYLSWSAEEDYISRSAEEDDMLYNNDEE